MTKETIKKLESIDKNMDFIDNVEDLTRKAIDEWSVSGALWRQLEWCIINRSRVQKMGDKIVNEMNAEFFNQFYNYAQD